MGGTWELSLESNFDQESQQTIHGHQVVAHSVERLAVSKRGTAVLQNGTELTRPGGSESQGVLVGINPTYTELRSSPLAGLFIAALLHSFEKFNCKV